MPFLDQLDVTSASPARDRSPIGRFRRRLANAIRVQIQLAQAEQEGRSLDLTKQRWVRSAPGAPKELKQITLRVRRWWWTDDAGKTYLSLRSGARLLEIAPGKKAIRIDEATELPEKLRILCEAVIAGELDACAKEIAPPTARAGKEKAQSAPKSPQAGKENAAKAH